MLCLKPAIPSNSYIIYPRSNQVNYTHGTRVFLACRDGHYLKGSPIMLCNRTVWFKKEFSCIGKYLWRIQPRRVDSVEGVLLSFWRFFFWRRRREHERPRREPLGGYGGMPSSSPGNFANYGSLKYHFLHVDIISEVGCILLQY